MKTQNNKIAVIDKVYKLKNDAAPLSFTLPSRSSKRFPLLWFDEENNVNRPLRYAINQKSPFEDEQDGNAILATIIFEDGFLRVPKTNPNLQQFLHYHPLNGSSFVEVNNERDAEQEVQWLSVEADALIKARELSLEEIELMTRVLFNRDPSRYTTAELKRDILVYAKRDPRGFLNVMDDSSLRDKSHVRSFFEAKLLTFRNSNKEIWFNTPSNKKKMVVIPYGEDPYEIAIQFLHSDEGIESLKMLESNMELL
jgi:hypothetical protein